MHQKKSKVDWAVITGGSEALCSGSIDGNQTLKSPTDVPNILCTQYIHGQVLTSSLIFGLANENSPKKGLSITRKSFRWRCPSCSCWLTLRNPRILLSNLLLSQGIPTAKLRHCITQTELVFSTKRSPQLANPGAKQVERRTGWKIYQPQHCLWNNRKHDTKIQLAPTSL